jgi:hypothetical protein
MVGKHSPLHWQGQYLRWITAAWSSVAIGHAALDTARNPGQTIHAGRGILVIREHAPEEPATARRR